MGKPQQITLLITEELKQQLEQWAKEDDRTQSAELRWILAREAARRQQAEKSKQTN
jgi:hypothetical protein